MGEIGWDELIVSARRAVEPLGYASSTVWQYEHGWRLPAGFAEQRGEAWASRAMVDAFIDWWAEEFDSGRVKRARYLRYRRAALVLVEVLATGGYQWRLMRRVGPNDKLTGGLLDTELAYEQFLTREGYAKGTMEAYLAMSRRLLAHLGERGWSSLADVTLRDVPGLVSMFTGFYQATSMRTVCCGLRSLFRFAHNVGLTRRDLAAAVPGWGTRRTTVVATVSPEQARVIVKTPDVSTSAGLRDRAMLVMAVEYGLRPSDITGLRLTDVNWRLRRVTIIQAKTGVPLVLPLTGRVGQALAEYVLEGRPESDSGHVFLRAVAPFHRLGEGSNAWKICNKAVTASSVVVPATASRGFRLLRTAAATRLLGAGVTLDAISTVLGHRDPGAAKHYLATDEDNMRRCCLGLPGALERAA